MCLINGTNTNGVSVGWHKVFFRSTTKRTGAAAV